jgi:hypothetical protein
MPSIVKLNKSIYGLKQAASDWRNHLHGTIMALGFKQNKADHCVYTLTQPSGKIILATHVDDILIAASSINLQDWFTQSFTSTYEITINSPLTSYLGMTIVRDRENNHLFLNQPGYIDQLSDKFQALITPTSPSTPMPTNHAVSNITHDNLSVKEQHLYMSLVGSLLYLSVRTRPDISFAVGMCALTLKQATTNDLQLAQRILNYIMGTRHLGLSFNGNLNVSLTATADASYAMHSDRRSHFGITLHLGDSTGAVHSISKKARVMAVSSTEAEYLALFEASKLVAWARQFMDELGYPQLLPTPIFEDNKSTIHIVHNGNDKGKTKHIDVRYHYIQELQANKQVNILYLDTLNMTSDMLTKALATKPFLHLRNNILGNPPVSVSNITGVC